MIKNIFVVKVSYASSNFGVRQRSQRNNRRCEFGTGQFNINILDISQTTLQEFFAMFMLVDMTESTTSFHEINQKLEDKGKELGMQIRIQREDIFNAMHEI
jgi:ACT domain-containing protein